MIGTFTADNPGPYVQVGLLRYSSAARITTFLADAAELARTSWIPEQVWWRHTDTELTLTGANFVRHVNAAGSE
mgnify:CR=1 FL=1